MSSAGPGRPRLVFEPCQGVWITVGGGLGGGGDGWRCLWWVADDNISTSEVRKLGGWLGHGVIVWGGVIKIATVWG